MEHHFDIEIAKKLNVNCAVIYNNIQFWTAKNRANNHNFIDGKYWTYNSVKAWSELLPYLTQKQIRTALEKLESSGLIISGMFNKSKYDRTKWYALKVQNDLPSKANGIEQKGEPIPDNKPDNKPINNVSNKKDFDLIELVAEIFEDENISNAKVNYDAFNEWRDYRKESKKTLTKTTAKKQIKFLIKYDADTQRQIIDASIMGGYQGLFEPRKTNNTNRASNSNFNGWS